MLENFHTTFGQPKYKAYIKPKKAGDRSFVIDHYAGEVIYMIEGFVEKNKDELSPDILNLLEVRRRRACPSAFTCRPLIGRCRISHLQVTSEFQKLGELARQDTERKKDAAATKVHV